MLLLLFNAGQSDDWLSIRRNSSNDILSTVSHRVPPRVDPRWWFTCNSVSALSFRRYTRCRENINAGSAAKTDRQHSDVACSFSLSCSLPFPPLLAASPLYGENLAFKLITQLLPLYSRKTRNSLCRLSLASLLLFFSFFPLASHLRFPRPLAFSRH